MSAKEIISKFYTLDFVKDANVMSYFHDDFEMTWNSSKGTLHYNLEDVKNLFSELKRNFHSYQAQIHQLHEESNFVTVRFTVYVTAIERPEKEDALANFISIVEVKDSKVYKINQISQLADH
ncbi:nuclear transport factor 2 family protein [Aurantibacter aestuarii]|uniref:SnoaL-like domain-containing protein n=1 Tax=Aurantibacter aestuarii TaxID=1266046 RepID=A0A2T1N8T0_9FLAO|nr:nuclear transport factor 2 family protein [Aurantibacter aestuarii]PSG88242.1 hypothetical protein C7H52_08015 [Aurantibacter aestuarii]